MIDVEVICGDRRLHGSQPVTPREAMMSESALKKLIGDGKAGVSTALSFASKDYGNGYEVRVSVSLACDQSEEGVAAASRLALDLAAGNLEEGKAAAEALYGALNEG
jgi:hypothetical protein